MARKKRSKKSKVRRGAENVIMTCLAFIVGFSGWKIYSIQHDYSENQSIYDEIVSQAQEETQEEGDKFTGDIDWAALRKINPDVVAWIYYEDSMINYPIVKGKNNDKYLHQMFDGTYSGFGTLFVDAVTDKPFDQFNTIVYGHHMLNGSMFGDLRNLKDPEYCKEHPQFELITPEGKYHLIVCAFLNQPSDSAVYNTNITKESDKQKYIDLVMSHSVYITSEEMTPEDNLVVLSTCAYEYQNARYMVVARMIPWE